ncbi:hypothetical protein [Hydrogenivirga sp. 128-5-R1-1]|uniref:hypothetical protein n=1 Tax=Hydrogenivirga sp. 128-5-R1-1 TaxID=392423 RepID=UPI00015F1454|nr:hypothetical protein [Hydrogenivirga sp. 128-5-R1-1]EDP73586.1 hypothetical protein HG1285_10001 [Hydrogenivirga sp. 128-5-R1-1]
MPDSSFHEGKIDEILDAYSDSLFIQGVCLFYIGVHAVDYVLAEQFDIEDIATHRGRKKRITENMDWETSESFAKLLTYSLAIRYNEISSIEIIEKMKESLKELILHLEQQYNFPVEIRERIFDTIKSTTYL